MQVTRQTSASEKSSAYFWLAVESLENYEEKLNEVVTGGGRDDFERESLEIQLFTYIAERDTPSKRELWIEKV